MARNSLPLELLQATADAVRAAGGNRALAARTLGVHPATLRERLTSAQRRGIDVVPATLGRAAGAPQKAPICDKKGPICDEKGPFVNKTAPIANNSVAGAMAPGAKLDAIPPLSGDAQQRWDEIDKQSRHELWKKWAREGRTNRALLDFLIEREQPKLVQWVTRYHQRFPSEVDLDDFISDANVRILGDVLHYDPERTAFWTWAGPRVFGGIKDGLRERDHVPRLVRSMQTKRQRFEENFENWHGRRPAAEETMYALKWSREQWGASFPRGTDSIEQTVGQSDYEKLQSLRDLLRACEEAPESALDADAFWDDVTKPFSTRERIIFCLRYQFGATMKSIGACLELSESRVSQMMSALDKRAVDRLTKERAA